MSNMQAPENTAVWIDEGRCKACDVCVTVCPSGTLAMVFDNHHTLGAVAKVMHGESCIGCKECELACPDFAIFVAEKQEFKFAKLTEESKARQAKIVANGYKYPSN